VDPDNRAEREVMTGGTEAASKVLCDVAREVLAEERIPRSR
jgi:hypothetical protein